MFSVTKEQDAKIHEWLKTVVYPPIVAEQRKNPEIAMWIVKGKDGIEYPYSGAIGGDITYSFTPTSLGTCLKVTSFGQELDITEYDQW